MELQAGARRVSPAVGGWRASGLGGTCLNRDSDSKTTRDGWWGGHRAGGGGVPQGRCTSPEEAGPSWVRLCQGEAKAREHRRGQGAVEAASGPEALGQGVTEGSRVTRGLWDGRQSRLRSPRGAAAEGTWVRLPIRIKRKNYIARCYMNIPLLI